MSQNVPDWSEFKPGSLTSMFWNKLKLIYGHLYRTVPGGNPTILIGHNSNLLRLWCAHVQRGQSPDCMLQIWVLAH